MRFHPTREKVVLAGLAIAAAGGTAAVAVPAIAAHSPSAPSASAPASTDGSAVTASGARAVARTHLIGLLLRSTLKETGLDRATLLQRLGAGETIDQIAGSKA